MAQNELNYSKTHFADFWMIRNFPRKTAVYVSCPYRVEPSCKKAKKSLEPFPSVVSVYVIENPNLFCEWCICPPFPSFPSFGIIIITYCQKCRLYIKTHKYYTNYIWDQKDIKQCMSNYHNFRPKRFSSRWWESRYEMYQMVMLREGIKRSIFKRRELLRNSRDLV